MDTNKLNMINYVRKIRDELYIDAYNSNPSGMYVYERQLNIIAEYITDIIKKSSVVYSCDKAKMNYREKMEYLWDYQQHFNHYYKRDFEKIDKYNDLCK